MRVRLLLLAAAALAAVPGGASANHYDRSCREPVDVMCQAYRCPALDCFWYDCDVYLYLPDGTNECYDW